MAFGGCAFGGWEVSLVRGVDEAVLGFLDFFGSVYLVVILVWVWEVSEDEDLVVCWRTHGCGPCRDEQPRLLEE